MNYTSLEECIHDLEKHGRLLRIKKEVDPMLEMSAIQLEAYARGEKAVYFEKIKGCRYPAVSNLFGSVDRAEFMFRKRIKTVKNLIRLRKNPAALLSEPSSWYSHLLALYGALPKKVSAQSIRAFEEIRIEDLPQITHWPDDGGPFITLPQVYTEDPNKPGIMHGNLGMYRIQLGGNAYVPNHEIGLHYQLHRGIGVHQTAYREKGMPMPVSIFVGGPPSHTLAAVMPLPEGLGEAVFAGMLGGRRFRYFYDRKGFCISADADFVITGYVHHDETKPEGPFGDHLGYYSLTHPFPVMRVEKVYAKKNAIWPFTVVGRPPQEDTSFGAIIHELTGDALPDEIPGLHAVNAVDAAGVHPLLLATGSERYTPYLQNDAPAELLTIANHVLGKGQLSLAKYLFILDLGSAPGTDVKNEKAFFREMLLRLHTERDLHFYTKTSIDTLDYSGTGLNSGSKVVFAAAGKPIRALGGKADKPGWNITGFSKPEWVGDGILAMGGPSYTKPDKEEQVINFLADSLLKEDGAQRNLFPLLILCDDPVFVADSFSNFLWVTFTRSNPSHDIFGAGQNTQFKHWGCAGPVIIDARIKPHHAPAVHMPDHFLLQAKETLHSGKQA
ncbi:MAG: UbiD family decarboxylase [Bacteroidota bacterium]|jgi:4-hydroxy-3-polyprenylbenzoate decarboxylase